MTARTPDECATLARMLMEQAEQALADNPSGLGRDLYDRLVAAAQVWATLSTRPTDLEPITATLDSMTRDRLAVGTRVVLAHYSTRGTLVLDGDGVGTITNTAPSTEKGHPQYEVTWDDLRQTLTHPAAMLVAVSLP